MRPIQPLSGLVRRYVTPVMLIRLVPMGIVLATGLLLSIWTHGLLSRHQMLVVHTHEVIETAKDVLIGLDDAETGQRGFLLSDQQRHLEPYRRARERLDVFEAQMRRMVVDNADQVARMHRLSGLIRTKLGELAASIEARERSGFDAAVALMLRDSDQATMDAIRVEIGAITEGEKALLRLRDAEVEADERRIRSVAILVGLASLLTRFAVEFYLSLRARNAAASPPAA